MTDGLTARSSSGAWVVTSGGRMVGPFDGRTPALAFARRLRNAGFEADLARCWSPSAALVAAGLLNPASR